MSLPHTPLLTVEGDTDVGPTPAAIRDGGEEEGGRGGGGDTQAEDTSPEPTPVVSGAVSADTDTGDDMSLYQLKWVEWKGEFAPVITQNENGPCPLIALCNVLILSSRMKIAAGDTVVTSTHLLDLLGTTIIENVPKDLSEGERANYEQNIQDAMATFPKLQTGLDVNVKFDSARGFEFTSETVIFDLLNVPLYHGWLPDSQDELTYKAVKGCSYNQLVEKVVSGRTEQDHTKQQEALAAELFLESAASQLTYCGLCELGSVMEEGELAVFFRNNHFSTILKRKGHLLLLVTDHGFVNEHGHVWQTLSSTDGDEHFMDGRFRLSGHSETQQKREEGVGKDKNGSPEKTTPTDTAQTDADYQTALTLQQEEYSAAAEQEEEEEEEVTQALRQETYGGPPNTAEEYERQSQLDRIRRGRRRDQSDVPSCTLL